MIYFNFISEDIIRYDEMKFAQCPTKISVKWKIVFAQMSTWKKIFSLKCATSKLILASIYWKRLSVMLNILFFKVISITLPILFNFIPITNVFTFDYDQWSFTLICFMYTIVLTKVTRNKDIYSECRSVFSEY